MTADKLRLSSPDNFGSSMPLRPRFQSGIRRRELMLTTATTLLFSTNSVLAGVVQGGLPWEQNAGAPPAAVKPGAWTYFTGEEGAAIEALVDRLIPPDPPDAGRQGCRAVRSSSTDNCAGPYGAAEGLYMRGPFADGTPQQGDQSPLTPAARYRQALAALDKYCRATYAGKSFAQIPDNEKDKIALTAWRRAKCSWKARAAGLLRAAAAEHAGRFLRRPGLRRQPRHGRLEDDRISRRALRLPGLGRPAQRTLSAAAGRHRRPSRMDSETRLNFVTEGRQWHASCPQPMS